MNVLVVHQDQAIAEEPACSSLLEHGFNALPLSRSLDALEHVEKLRFDVQNTEGGTVLSPLLYARTPVFGV